MEATASARRAAAAPPAVPEPLGPGERLAGAVVQACVGIGPTGFTYRVGSASGIRAVRECLPPGLAVRTASGVQPLPGCEDALRRVVQAFESDVLGLQGLRNSALLPVFGMSSHGASVSCTMPWLDGVTLADIGVQAFVGMARAESLRALCSALAAWHRAQVVHANVNPRNVQVLPSGALVLMEPGGARQAVLRERVRLGLSAGQVDLDGAYAAAELCLPAEPGLVVGPWTDVYGLAAIWHEALSGSAPPPARQRWQRDSAQPLTRRSGQKWPQVFLHGLDLGLAVRPGMRPQTVGALLIAMGLAERRARSRNDGSAFLVLPLDEAAVAASRANPAVGHGHPPFVDTDVLLGIDSAAFADTDIGIDFGASAATPAPHVAAPDPAKAPLVPARSASAASTPWSMPARPAAGRPASGRPGSPLQRVPAHIRRRRRWPAFVAVAGFIALGLPPLWLGMPEGTAPVVDPAATVLTNAPPAADSATALPAARPSQGPSITTRTPGASVVASAVTQPTGATLQWPAAATPLRRAGNPAVTAGGAACADRLARASLGQPLDADARAALARECR